MQVHIHLKIFVFTGVYSNNKVPNFLINIPYIDKYLLIIDSIILILTFFVKLIIYSYNHFSLLLEEVSLPCMVSKGPNVQFFSE